MRLDDRLIELFPDEAPENPSENLCRATIRDALTMCIGQSRGYLMGAQRVGMPEEDWAKAVLARRSTKRRGRTLCTATSAVSGGAGGAEARRVRPCGLPDAAAVCAAGDSAHGLGG